MKYRVFTNDIAPGRYSCLAVLDEPSDEKAEKRARKMVKGLLVLHTEALKVLVIPDDRKDLMPDGQTGRLPK